jgi:hypothetical protein
LHSARCQILDEANIAVDSPGVLALSSPILVLQEVQWPRWNYPYCACLHQFLLLDDVSLKEDAQGLLSLDGEPLYSHELAAQKWYKHEDKSGDAQKAGSWSWDGEPVIGRMQLQDALQAGHLFRDEDLRSLTLCKEMLFEFVRNRAIPSAVVHEAGIPSEVVGNFGALERALAEYLPCTSKWPLLGYWETKRFFADACQAEQTRLRRASSWAPPRSCRARPGSRADDGGTA